MIPAPQARSSRLRLVKPNPERFQTMTTVFQNEADRLETNLAEQRQQLRANPANRVLELAIEAGDERVRQLLRDHDAHVHVERDREAADAARAQDARAELEAKLMSAYIASAPGTTAAEAKAALPDLLHRHRLAEQDRMDAALVEAKKRIGSF